MPSDERNSDPVRSDAQGRLLQTAPADLGTSRVRARDSPHLRRGVHRTADLLADCRDRGPDVVSECAGLNFPFAIASLIFYAACSLALRSRTIAGTLLGLSIYPFTGPTVYPDHDWKTRLLGCGILGLVWGIAWEALHSSKPSKHELPTA